VNGENARADQRPLDGTALVRIDMVGTALFVVVAAVSVVSQDLAKSVGAPFSFALGAVGIVAFIWSYALAVERSRTDEISVTQLYLVSGDVAPPRIKRALRAALTVQVAVALTAMSIGFARTKPAEFNWAACTIVTPLFGFGMNGVWVSRHGRFAARILAPRKRRPVPDATGTVAGEGNNDHEESARDG
jgi:hypothetical protein